MKRFKNLLLPSSLILLFILCIAILFFVLNNIRNQQDTIQVNTKTSALNDLKAYTYVYLDNGEIYIANYDKTKLTLLTHTNNHISQFVKAKDNTYIYYTVTDPDISNSIKQKALALLNANPNNPSSVSKDAIDQFVNISVKLYSLNLQTLESKLLIDYSDLSLNLSDLSTYYTKPLNRISLNILAINNYATKLVYTRDGAWAYDITNGKSKLIDSDAGTYKYLNTEAFVGNNVVSLKESGEGSSNIIYKFDGQNYTELNVKGIELGGAPGKTIASDDFVVGIDSNDDLYVLDVSLDNNQTHNSIYKIDHTTGNTTKIITSNITNHGVCAEVTNNKLLISDCKYSDTATSTKLNIFDLKTSKLTSEEINIDNNKALLSGTYEINDNYLLFTTNDLVKKIYSLKIMDLKSKKIETINQSTQVSGYLL